MKHLALALGLAVIGLFGSYQYAKPDSFPPSVNSPGLFGVFLFIVLFTVAVLLIRRDRARAEAARFKRANEDYAMWANPPRKGIRPDLLAHLQPELETNIGRAAAKAVLASPRAQVKAAKRNRAVPAT